MVEAGVVDIGGDKIEDPEGIYESLRNVFTYNGEFVCPPKDFSTLTLIYNRDMSTLRVWNIRPMTGPGTICGPQRKR